MGRRPDAEDAAGGWWRHFGTGARLALAQQAEPELTGSVARPLLPRALRAGGWPIFDVMVRFLRIQRCNHGRPARAGAHPQALDHALAEPAGEEAGLSWG